MLCVHVKKERVKIAKQLLVRVFVGMLLFEVTWLLVFGFGISPMSCQVERICYVGVFRKRERRQPHHTILVIPPKRGRRGR